MNDFPSFSIADLLAQSVSNFTSEGAVNECTHLLWLINIIQFPVLGVSEWRPIALIKHSFAGSS